MKNCEVCGTEVPPEKANDPVRRRYLAHAGREVYYCADVVECGEAAAMEYLTRVFAFEEIGDRERTMLQQEGRVALGTDPSLAAIVAMVDDLGLDPTKVRLTYTIEDNGVYVYAEEGA